MHLDKRQPASLLSQTYLLLSHTYLNLLIQTLFYPCAGYKKLRCQNQANKKDNHNKEQVEVEKLICQQTLLKDYRA